MGRARDRSGICVALAHPCAARCRSQAGRRPVAFQVRPRPQSRRGRRFARAFAKFGTAQPASWRQQRQGFEEIGLARPIVSGQHDEARINRKIKRGVGAKIGQREPPHARLTKGSGAMRVTSALAPRETFHSLPEKTPVDYVRRPYSPLKPYIPVHKAGSRPAIVDVRRRHRHVMPLAPNRPRMDLLIASKSVTLQAARGRK